MKLGVITDGISRKFEHALDVMKERGLRHAELQYLWDMEVGELDDAEIGRVQDLIRRYEMEVCCVSRHNFGGLVVGQTEVGDAAHSKHMAALKRCIDTAKALDCGLVRIMSFRKEIILFGSGGSCAPSLKPPISKREMIQSKTNTYRGVCTSLPATPYLVVG